MEAASNLGNKVVSGSKGTNTMALQFSAATSGSMVYTDEFDTSVATLNLVCALNFCLVSLKHKNFKLNFLGIILCMGPFD